MEFLIILIIFLIAASCAGVIIIHDRKKVLPIQRENIYMKTLISRYEPIMQRELIEENEKNKPQETEATETEMLGELVDLLKNNGYEVIPGEQLTEIFENERTEPIENEGEETTESEPEPEPVEATPQEPIPGEEETEVKKTQRKKRKPRGNASQNKKQAS